VVAVLYGNNLIPCIVVKMSPWAVGVVVAVAMAVVTAHVEMACASAETPHAQHQEE